MKTINPSGLYPAVTIEIKDSQAAWFGKWAININSDSIRKLGGPWLTKSDCKAVCDRINKAWGLFGQYED